MSIEESNDGKRLYHHMGKNIKSIINSEHEDEKELLQKYDAIVEAIDALHLTKGEFNEIKEKLK